MRDSADESPSLVVWKLRIGIKCNDVTHTCQKFLFGRGNDVTRIARSAQEPIELMKFAAFSFPPHPFLFARIPFATSMKEIKPIGRRLLILGVQLLKAFQ